MSLVIGYGNTLCGDDGLGVIVAERLLQSGLPASVTVITAHQLYPEMAEAISQAARVIFVDARATGSPGTLIHERLVPLQGDGALVHHVQPGQILSVAAVLYGRCPPADLVTITGQNFDLGSDLSDVVCDGIAEIVEIVRHLALSDPLDE